ncbi:MAG: hypothetical protein RSB41_02025 [Bacilli bacterium]
MKDLYIDFDGVIMNTIEELYKKAQEEGKDKEDKDFYINFDFSTIIKDEFILNDSINCINKLIESKKFNISILTHVFSISEGEVKINYINKKFNDLTIIIVPKSIEKTMMVHTKDAILVDDYANNLRLWEKEDGIGIRFSIKGNGKGFKCISRLDMLLDMF